MNRMYENDENARRMVENMEYSASIVPSLDQPEQISKKAKLLKKLNKPPKEPKVPKEPKIKKPKKESPEKKTKASKQQLIDLTKEMPFAVGGSKTNMGFFGASMANIANMANMGFLNQFPGPGLIPTNPLFQSVRFDMPGNEQISGNYFPGLPGFDLSNLSRFKRPNFNDPQQNDLMLNNAKHFGDTSSTSAVKPLCNVAPLMPPSLLNPSNEQPSMSHSSADYIQQGNPFSKKHLDAPLFSSQSNMHLAGASSSPILIDSEEDDKLPTSSSAQIDYSISNPIQSPQTDRQQSDGAFGDEAKRHKKIKDKSSGEKKKEKRDKEGGGIKMKKKKDKKDKSKSKHMPHDGDDVKPIKDKAALKKEKREKKKERDRLAALAAASAADIGNLTESSNTGFGRHSDWHDAFPLKEEHQSSHAQSYDNPDGNEYGADTSSNMETSVIPKLTLKLAPSSSSPSSRPSTPDFPSIPRKR